MRALRSRAKASVADLYVLAHGDFGPISAFLTREQAEDELKLVFGNEPTWVGKSICRA
jgi:hypothetical protein